jgi:hypothetical protein
MKKEVAGAALTASKECIWRKRGYYRLLVASSNEQHEIHYRKGE